ncbi:LysM peptidoglycan-binding domain-containing protein [Ligilactobacillus araffinosus]|uniref:Peptidoglycan binding protein, lysm domain protein n=1 Tax=Ligilactobacillus araffinosus DSM 20653 TaxID=1423820 RepID=A0A0R1ZD89_9LACO|nr:LysM peptidoglycan-binding domain-containing protein [Ligilactobacillus araffinosus]KRM52733.1 peptidoglycan binding protein, lysm domain protein [Ligilactobacillus araffinosus DSM 20653]
MRIKKFLLTIAAAFGLITVSAVAANADTVTVKSGDTLSKIATEYNTTVSSIQQLNHLADVNLIYAGEQLQVNGTQNNQVNGQPQATVQQSAASNNQAKQNQNAQLAAQSSQTTRTTANNGSNSSASSNLSNSDAAAKAWIVARESGGNYNARNGQYVGAYQLSASYLNGDYSPAHQDEVANQYVTSRYGSWVNAQKHWQECGWY